MDLYLILLYTLLHFVEWIALSVLTFFVAYAKTTQRNTMTNLTV